MKLINYNPMTMIYFDWEPSVGLVGNWNQWSNQESALLAVSQHEVKRTLINFEWVEKPTPIVSDNGVEAMASKVGVQQGINYQIPPFLVNSLVKFNPINSLKTMFHTNKIYVLANHPFVQDLQNLLGNDNVVVVQPPQPNNFLPSLKEDLLSGQLTDYHKKVGANYEVKGAVVKAKQLGRKLGFPTANLIFKNGLPIKEGVYLVKAWLPNETEPHWGMADYWNSPGFGMTLETYIFDFDKDIYGWVITIELVQFYRENTPLNSEEEIKTKLTSDYQALKKLIK
ncbi:riboflavin kinase [Entomoplasma freundtii]|uniref:riboflavin kinase n=1 Tax=Entomoplasma freundtii TaxID=74700 RepID=A0A2K8NS18_9MOLU|nr:riboflavin kinase [Entomoplasma freundtii]ATZ16346.1 riboflavin kinase/FAD synthetase [Entomoplasma freundtii]TDY56615.1 riboflavin kinase [Entomoplasma freundtii]